MKNKFLLIIASLALIVSCQDSDKKMGNPEITLPEGSENVLLTNANNTSVLNFTSAEEWSISIVDKYETKAHINWIKIDKMYGEAGEVTLNITADKNTTDADRVGKIVIGSQLLTKVVTVTQAAKDGIVLDKDAYSVENAGGQVEVTYKSNIAVAAEIDKDAQSWLTIKATKAMTENTLVFTATENPNREDRVATITLKGGEAPAKTFTITQKQKEYEVKRLGMYVLTEGTFGQNNSVLGMLNPDKTIDLNYFTKINTDKTALGDTATDIVVYGGKTYIIVNFSDKITVLNAYNGKFIKDIDLKAHFGATTQPRFALGEGGDLYVSTYHQGLITIDTTELKVDKKIELSEYFHEQLASYNGNIYVANSGIEGDYYGGKGTTVSIVSVDSQKEIGTIKVPVNPNVMQITPNGKMYLTTWGNWSSEESRLHKIDLGTKKIEKTWEDFGAQKFAVSDKFIFSYHFSYITFQMYVKKIDINTNEATTFMENPKKDFGLRSIYNICSDPKTNDIYFLDQSCLVVRFDGSGKFIEKYDFKDSSVSGMMNTNMIEFLDLEFEKK